MPGNNCSLCSDSSEWPLCMTAGLYSHFCRAICVWSIILFAYIHVLGQISATSLEWWLLVTIQKWINTASQMHAYVHTSELQCPSISSGTLFQTPNVMAIWNHGFQTMTETLPGGPHQEADASAPFHSRLGSVLEPVSWLALEPSCNSRRTSQRLWKL